MFRVGHLTAELRTRLSGRLKPQRCILLRLEGSKAKVKSTLFPHPGGTTWSSVEIEGVMSEPMDTVYQPRSRPFTFTEPR